MWQCNSICPYPRLHCGSFQWADLQSPLWKGRHLSQTAPHQTAALIVSSLAPSGWKGQTAIFRGVTERPKMTPDCVPGASSVLFSGLLTKQQVVWLVCLLQQLWDECHKYSSKIRPSRLHLYICVVSYSIKHISHCSTHFGRKPQKVAYIPPFQKGDNVTIHARNW